MRTIVALLLLPVRCSKTNISEVLKAIGRNTMLTMLKGNRTYIVGVAIVVYEVLGYLLGKSPTLDVRGILEGVGLVTLRAAIAAMKS